jgi:hypothetical protein
MKKKNALQLLSLGRAVFVLSAFLIAALSSARADEPCTLATLTGPYVFTTLGQEPEGYASTLFVLTADGNGNFSGSGTESLNGKIFSNVTATGTYTADHTCWFTATITDSLGNVRDFSGTVLLKGNRINGISTDLGSDWQFTAFFEHRTACTVSSGEGYVVTSEQSPLTPYGPSTAAEQWSISKRGTGTGSWVANYGGTISQGTATATFNTNADCTYTETITRSDGSTANYYGVKGLDGFDTVIWLAIETDKGWVSISTITLLCSYWPRC